MSYRAVTEVTDLDAFSLIDRWSARLRTNRATDTETLHTRHKGVRTFAVQHDDELISQACGLLRDSNLPAPVVDVLLARLQPTP